MENEERAAKLLMEALDALATLSTYRCVIHSQDRIRGKLLPPETIQSCFASPGSVYLRWLPGPHKGLQASHVPDRDGPGKFMARETGLKGLVGALTWSNDSPIIDNLYPHNFRAHETSIHFLVRLARDISAKARAAGTFRVPIVRDETDTFRKRPATLVVTELSSDPKDGLRWPKTEFWFDHETRLPLHHKLHDFDGALYGEYAFMELEAGVKLPADAFELKKL